MATRTSMKMPTYLITTKHSEYAKRQFPPGSVVIDPWRYIPKQHGVELISVGRNRPAKISLLIPSRGRPEMFKKCIDSAYATATYPRQVEVVAWFDQDDSEFGKYWDLIEKLPVLYLRGERTLLSKCWNHCYERATGEIFMHLGDDVIFRTPGWDVEVRDAFDAVPDKILFAYGNDLGPHGETFGTHGFVHRRWVETVGYFLPPLFSCDWNDVWLNEVAEEIGRKQLLPIVTEHMHYTFGKADRDQTHAEREERGARDNVVEIYQQTKAERREDIKKLRAVMS